MSLDFKKKEDVQKFTSSDFFQLCKENYFTVAICLFFMLFSVLGFQLVVQTSNLILSVLTSVLPLFFYLLMKDLLEEKQQKLALVFFKIELLFSVAVVLNDVFLSVFRSVSDTIDFSFIIYLVDFGLVLAYIALGVGKAFQDLYEKIDGIHL